MVAAARRIAVAGRGVVIVEVKLPKFLWEFAMSHPKGGGHMIEDELRKAYATSRIRKYRMLAERLTEENRQLRARVAELENR